MFARSAFDSHTALLRTSFPCKDGRVSVAAGIVIRCFSERLRMVRDFFLFVAKRRFAAFGARGPRTLELLPSLGVIGEQSVYSGQGVRSEACIEPTNALSKLIKR